VATERTRILVDAGLSRREIAKRLAAIGEDIARLDAVLVTHEHCDHTNGLVALLKAAKAPLPVYLTCGTAQFIDWDECAPTLQVFQAGCGFSIGDFDVTSFTVPHDAVDPVGFTLCSQGMKMAIATDLGYVTDSLRVHLKGSHVIVLESNHDLEMLRVGPYPWSVKQRVMSRRGHLSNEVAAEFIAKDLDSCVDTVILGHISEHNNHPELVRNLALRSIRNPLFTKLFVAEPGLQSPVFCY
jgi:phosphoribosyl 1,2-cyclic phosphodiesterase